MNSTIELPTGKILDLNRFVALFPENETTKELYSLILEGCSHMIHLDRSEADIVKQYLQLQKNHSKNGSWDREEQLKKNQPAIKLLKERIERHKLMSKEESKQRAEFFADFQKTIDAERSIRKLSEN
jgi:hypothetical protein